MVVTRGDRTRGANFTEMQLPAQTRRTRKSKPKPKSPSPLAAPSPSPRATPLESIINALSSPFASNSPTPAPTTKRYVSIRQRKSAAARKSKRATAASRPMTRASTRAAASRRKGKGRYPARVNSPGYPLRLHYRKRVRESECRKLPQDECMSKPQCKLTSATRKNLPDSEKHRYRPAYCRKKKNHKLAAQ